jgi:predicted RNase H-like nuclease (RuvC/YqgF family)
MMRQGSQATLGLDIDDSGDTIHQHQVEVKMLRTIHESMRESVESLEQDNAYLSSNYEVMLKNEESLRTQLHQLQVRSQFDVARCESETFQLTARVQALERHRNVLLRHLGDLMSNLKQAIAAADRASDEEHPGDEGAQPPQTRVFRDRIQHLVDLYSEKGVISGDDEGDTSDPRPPPPLPQENV